jgi:hypothetical protein
MELTNIQNDEINYKEQKQLYNKERYQKLKEKMKEQTKQYYIKRISENPEYRNLLNERTKKRQQMKNEGTEPRPRGRPKTAEPKEKKPNGRPRKYIIN